MKVLLDHVHAAPVLRQADPGVRRRLKHALRLLAQDPTGRSARLDVKRLDADAGQPIYRLRVGEWRIAFTLDRDIVVLRLFHRSEGYGWLGDLE